MRTCLLNFGSSHNLRYRILRDFLVAGHEAESLMQSLGNENPVKRVAAVIR